MATPGVWPPAKTATISAKRSSSESSEGSCACAASRPDVRSPAGFSRRRASSSSK
ncbi:MAG: hypothetical protein WDO13_15680 [Verrucomicrobiota bacterium]